ncbi:sigma-70 family RNA polymerase sigma factor [Erythrobacter sp. HL-111]|uniref:sigma-70 family RNA polymerase sigma factor n=1 Tax=Erythrobacter sp. HL-111 TaxID=1798193 RepID=UPI0006D9A769|nr:sigma-70 family RNA polymerase sigma factor [Erythrobacter sp. HL-111]KPP92552.1 MAG: RNA polymerase sigma factor FliA [Erythrobacteraceae bacterium HL-111]SDS91612.1 RNA polymerase sigma factor for flagellar operon FliA [Erythrobacter sp. HL-111]
MRHDAAFHAAYGAASQAEVEDRVRRFLPMVHRAAWHIYGMGRDGIEVEDLVQTGIMALTECARRHSGPGEDGFAAYAKIRVRGAMLDQIRRLMNDTRTARKRRAAYERTVERLRMETGREPGRAEIAAALRISDGELVAIEASAVTITSISEEYDESNAAFASEEPDPFEALCAAEDRERLAAALGRLPDRLKLVLQLFFVEELNLTEIAAVLGVSVPRVHQLRAKALKDLRALMEEETG